MVLARPSGASRPIHSGQYALLADRVPTGVRRRSTAGARRQLAHATSIVVAVEPPQPEVCQDNVSPTEDIMITPARLLCALNLHHIWHGEHAEDGSRYMRCVRCGKDRSGSSGGGGDWAAPIGLG